MEMRIRLDSLCHRHLPRPPRARPYERRTDRSMLLRNLTVTRFLPICPAFLMVRPLLLCVPWARPLRTLGPLIEDFEMNRLPPVTRGDQVFPESRTPIPPTGASLHREVFGLELAHDQCDHAAGADQVGGVLELEEIGVLRLQRRGT